LVVAIWELFITVTEVSEQRLYDPARHQALSASPWDAARARDAIAVICRDAQAAFDPVRLWPTHPRDEEPGDPDDGIFRGLYLGAAGMLHGLYRLAHAGLCDLALDGPEIVAGLPAAGLASPDAPGAGSSLLMGSSGILLVDHALTGSGAAVDALADAVAANAEHPSNEMLLGAPGTMLAARAMYGRTGEGRFAEIWRDSAATLLSRQEPDGLWTQDLYGERLRYVGTGHGFAGNVLALLGAPEWLEDDASVERRALATAKGLAIAADDQVSWPSLNARPGSRIDPPLRAQWCHGAPGIITSLGRLGMGDAEYDGLLRGGGELAWRAGPLSANAGLCHGTAGNGFAFLVLAHRSGNERWLDRAQRFAMHALAQVERWRTAAGRGRYSLFTGDIGAALLAGACLTDDTRFPGIDDL
jgi:hypothetical protein